MKNKHHFLLVSLLLLGGACSSLPPATQLQAAKTEIPVTGTARGAPSEASVPASATPAPTIKTLVPTSNTCFELLTPESNAEIPAVGKISFTWQALPNAARYLLEITLPNESIASFRTGDTKISRYAESTAMGGIYQWKVTAFNAADEILCTAGPSSYSKPEKLIRKVCPPQAGCGDWDPVACECRGGG